MSKPNSNIQPATFEPSAVWDIEVGGLDTCEVGTRVVDVVVTDAGGLDVVVTCANAPPEPSGC
jgi:hypothetical protein